MNILIAEDDAVSRKIVTRMLENLGHNVTVCSDGEEAWQAYQQGDYPVVISDWMMPVTDGLELCRRIRKLAKQDLCFFVVLTARCSKADYLAAIWAGVDEYLTKPINKNEIEMRLRAAQRQVFMNNRKVAVKRPFELLTPVRSS